jgi:hypothetical protein
MKKSPTLPSSSEAFGSYEARKVLIIKDGKAFKESEVFMASN